MSEQEQFLDVISRDEAELRFRAAIRFDPLAGERTALAESLGRVLADDIVAPLDVPSFDRSNYDGFAVRAEDTFGAREEVPRRLRLLDEVLATAVVPRSVVEAGTAVTIATGAVVPRGADAVVMMEHADVVDARLLVRKAVTAGFGISFAGSDIAAGETILRRGQRLTSRETGVLAALGLNHVTTHRQPRVGIISTGDELIAPGDTMRAGLVFDSNGRILADAVRELGGLPVELGILGDNLETLHASLRSALDQCDVVVLSGGTSKGAGDLSYRVVSDLSDPGIVAHGVALKPGKPICLAATDGKPVVILPGFPTSAIFTFHEFVAPVIRRLAGLPPISHDSVSARLALKVNSEIGRTEYLLVGLVEATTGEDDKASTLALEKIAFPMGKGSGSVTTFSHADGFVTIDRHTEIVDAGQHVTVQLLAHDLAIADLVVIGSHCVGLDFLLGQLQASGLTTKFLAVGSTAGLDAARRGECDLAGIHLLDTVTGRYNEPFTDERLFLLPGYGRMQGVVHRRGDRRFDGLTAEAALRGVASDPNCHMVNRNQGSGTRILVDSQLGDLRPTGYAFESRSHTAVAAAVAQNRADWGLAIEGVAQQTNLGFLPLTEERFDFVVPRARKQRPAVQRFIELLETKAVREHLQTFGLR
jgi:putative molybdopterin biosynthesis protein